MASRRELKLARERRRKWLENPENREKDRKAALKRYYRRKGKAAMEELLNGKTEST